MDISSLSKRDSSGIGTAVGILVAAVAVLGGMFLDWEWNAFSSQPIPLVIGVVAAAVAVIIVVQKMRG